MSLYYEADGITLYHGDCREETAWLEADVLVTDPPYGRSWKQGARHKNGSDARSGIAGDLDTTVRDAALRAWGNRLAVVFGDLMLAPPASTKQVLVYRKPPDAGARGAVAGFRRDLEAVYLLGPWSSGLGGRSRLLTTAAPSLVCFVAARYPKDRGTGHPHTKPLDLIFALLSMCPDGVVADPFAGSGSTLVAARALGRRAVGVEIDERYCETVASRIAQGDLFGGAA